MLYRLYRVPLDLIAGLAPEFWLFLSRTETRCIIQEHPHQASAHPPIP